MIDLKKLREDLERWVKAGYTYGMTPESSIALIDQLEAAQQQAESNRVDAECFRWWVHEAAVNPGLVAKAIAHCITEDEYREVICGAMRKRDDAIKAAMQSTN